MSHIHTELELAAGLTVLVGPNNCGKSAVVEAIRTVCENSGKDFMVRHGEKFCRVTIETDDGHTIEWKRDKAVVSYTINGRDIHRLAKATPDDLHALLRLPPVLSPDGKDEFEIHIAPQKSPLFLLERTGREAAMFFASSSDAALVMDMQRRHKGRVTDRRRDQVNLIRQQGILKTQIESLDPIVQVDEKLRAAESLYEQIQTESAAAQRCTADLTALEQQLNIVQQAQDRFAAMRSLPTFPNFTETQPLEKLVNDLAREQRAIARGADQLKQLHTLAGPPLLDETAPLEMLCRQLRDHAVQVAIGHGKSQATRLLTEPPMLQDVAPLTALCEAIGVQSKLCDRLATDAKQLNRLTAPPDHHDAEKLNGLSAAISNVSSATDLLAQRTTEVTRATAAASTALAAIRQWAVDHPTCPVCGGAVDADELLLVGGHDHA